MSFNRSAFEQFQPPRASKWFRRALRGSAIACTVGFAMANVESPELINAGGGLMLISVGTSLAAAIVEAARDVAIGVRQRADLDLNVANTRENEISNGTDDPDPSAA